MQGIFRWDVEDAVPYVFSILYSVTEPVKVDINQKQRYNKRAYGQRFIKGGRPWNLEVVAAHPAEVAQTRFCGLFAEQEIRPDVFAPGFT